MQQIKQFCFSCSTTILPIFIVVKMGFEESILIWYHTKHLYGIKFIYLFHQPVQNKLVISNITEHNDKQMNVIPVLG